MAVIQDTRYNNFQSKIVELVQGPPRTTELPQLGICILDVTSTDNETLVV